MRITEEQDRFQTAGHKYIIRMVFLDGSGIWYEIWEDDHLRGRREEWPIRSGGITCGKDELIAEKRAMLEAPGEPRGQGQSGA